MNVIHIQPVLERRAFIAWRRELALFMVTEGYAPSLEHISEQHWQAYHIAGIDPPGAVLAEVARVD